MADNANGGLSASIFLDEIKTNIAGKSEYTPADSAEKWVFAEVSVSNGASTNLLGTGNDYLGSDLGCSEVYRSHPNILFVNDVDAIGKVTH